MEKPQVAVDVDNIWVAIIVIGIIAGIALFVCPGDAKIDVLTHSVAGIGGLAAGKTLGRP